MKPEYTGAESLELLKALFKTRAGRNAKVIHSLVINGNFCYIERQGTEEVTFRLRDINGNVISIKGKFSGTAASITDVSINKALDAVEFLYPLLLEAVIYAETQQNKFILIKLNNCPAETILVNTLKKIGFEVNSFSATLDLLEKEVLFISDLAKAVEAVSGYNILTDDVAKLVTFARIRETLSWIYVTDYEDSNISLTLEDEAGLILRLCFHFRHHARLSLDLGGYGKADPQIVSTLIDRALLHAVSKNAKFIECFLTFDGSPVDQVIEVLKSYGFRMVRPRLKMILELNDPQ